MVYVASLFIAAIFHIIMTAVFYHLLHWFAITVSPFEAAIVWLIMHTASIDAQDLRDSLRDDDK